MPSVDPEEVARYVREITAMMELVETKNRCWTINQHTGKSIPEATDGTEIDWAMDRYGRVRRPVAK